MNFKKNKKKLIAFKNEMQKYAYIEKSNIKPIINWKNKLQKKVKTASKIINLNECKSWYFDKKMNLCHESGQFFKIKGVKTKGATGREVQSWTQPILTQKHGSVEEGMEHYRSLGEQKGNEVIKQLSLKGLTHWTRLRGNGRWNFVETAPNKYDLAEHMTPKEISEIDKHEKSYYHHRNLSKQQFKGSEAGEQLALF